MTVLGPGDSRQAVRRSSLKEHEETLKELDRLVGIPGAFSKDPFFMRTKEGEKRLQAKAKKLSDFLARNGLLYKA